MKANRLNLIDKLFDLYVGTPQAHRDRHQLFHFIPAHYLNQNLIKNNNRRIAAECFLESIKYTHVS